LIEDGADDGDGATIAKIAFCEDTVKEPSTGEDIDLCPDADF